jgi:ABC-type transport system involved in cytochrome c biogenesis permease component
MCLDVKTEQSSSSSTGTAIEKAMTSGNFAAAKQAMLSAYNADLANVNKALAVIKTAPANVQAAFKALLSYETQFRNDIQSAQSEQALLASFETLGKNTSLVTDGTTIANWYTSVCGGTPITATTVSVP